MNELLFEIFLDKMESLITGYEESVETTNTKPLTKSIDSFIEYLNSKGIKLVEVGKYLFQFSSLDDWKKNNVTRYKNINFRDTIAIDASGKICVIRKNAERAEYPVMVYKIRRDI